MAARYSPLTGRELVAQACPAKDYRERGAAHRARCHAHRAGGSVFQSALYARSARRPPQFDVMIALGTHPPMSEEAICERLGITLDERAEAIGACSSSITNGTIPARLRAIGDDSRG